MHKVLFRISKYFNNFIKVKFTKTFLFELSGQVDNVLFHRFFTSFRWLNDR